MIWRWTIAGALLSTSLCSPLRAQSAALDDGVKLMREGQFDQALIKLQQAHSIAPHSGAVENLLGLTETQLGHSDEACRHYRNAIHLDPTQAAPHRNLGFSLLNSKDYSHAEPELREASRLDPSDKFAHDYLMLLALATNRDAEALAQATQAGELVDRDPDAAAALIEAEIRSGHVEDATILAALHTERPTHADTLMFLGSAFEMQQKMPEALEAYRAALVDDPSNPDRTLDYTRLLMDMDRYDEAIQVVQSGVGVNTTTALQLRLGAVEMIKGDYHAARNAFHVALDIDPSLDAAYVGLAQVEARQGNDADAIHILEAARSKFPNHYPLEYYFGLLAGRLGREQEAIVALENAVRLEPTSPDAFFELGKVYISQSNWAQARQIFEHLVALNPQFVPAHYRLSSVYAHLGLDSKAEMEAQQTHTLVDTQREEALRKLRETDASFQPSAATTPSSLP